MITCFAEEGNRETEWELKWGGRGLSIASIVLLGTGRRATSLGPWGPGGMGDLVSAGVGLG